MKLYHFKPNTWGEEFFVTSDSKENAIVALNIYLSNNERDPFYDPPPHPQWGDNYFEGYTINVHEPNVIVETDR